MTDAPKKRRGRPAKKKQEEVKEAPAFLDPVKDEGSQKEEKPKGRPKGAKNKNLPTVNETKTACIHCGKTTLIIKKVYPPVLICHRENGKTFNTLIRKLCECKTCKKHSWKNTFEIR